MHLTCLCLSAVLLMAHLCSPYPVMDAGLSEPDLELLKDLLYKLEESVPEQRDMDDPATETNNQDAPYRDGQQPETELDEALIRELLSAKNLKRVRNNTSRNSSGCFGRRMDRIGSMSSLGCNTVGRYNPKSV